MAVRGRTKNGRKKRTEGGKTVRDPQWSRTLMPYFTVALKQSPRDAERPTGWRGSIFRLTRDQISTLFFPLSTIPSSFFLRGQQQQPRASNVQRRLCAKCKRIASPASDVNARS